ncbi:MAG: DUF3795 domain-containing protein [bacterium]|nr:DUF3795 domain-containing protein [bacterium]
MKKIIAVCGLICTECPAYIAKSKNDNNLRKKTAEEWSKMFNAKIKAKDINCDGCISNSLVLFAHCNECEMRLCAISKKANNCGKCAEYPCKKISDFMAMVPSCKAVLEEERKKK